MDQDLLLGKAGGDIEKVGRLSLKIPHIDEENPLPVSWGGERMCRIEPHEPLYTGPGP